MPECRFPCVCQFCVLCFHASVTAVCLCQDYTPLSSSSSSSCPTQTLRRNAKIDRTFLGSAITQSTITSDPTFLSKLSKPVRGVATGSVIYAGGAHGAASAGVGVEPLQQYSTKISLYGQRQPSVRVSEVGRKFTFL